jgi:hypothetical protein
VACLAVNIKAVKGEWRCNDCENNYEHRVQQSQRKLGQFHCGRIGIPELLRRFPTKACGFCGLDSVVTSNSRRIMLITLQRFGESNKTTRIPQRDSLDTYKVTDYSTSFPLSPI